MFVTERDQQAIDEARYYGMGPRELDAEASRLRRELAVIEQLSRARQYERSSS